VIRVDGMEMMVVVVIRYIGSAEDVVIRLLQTKVGTPRWINETCMTGPSKLTLPHDVWLHSFLKTPCPLLIHYLVLVLVQRKPCLHS